MAIFNDAGFSGATIEGASVDIDTEFGGTSVYDNDIETEILRHVPYVGNRLLTFRADLPHQAMPVARVCYQLRSVIVFKCDVNNI